MIIAINNNKGGSLKTTTVTNLAGVLASKGKKVLIVDADSQSNVSLSFKVKPEECEHTIYNVLIGNTKAEDAIKPVHENIDILPSNIDFIAFDFEVIGNREKYSEPFMLMRDALEPIEDRYDYILIDTPPSLSLVVGNAFAWADSVLIPFTPEFYSMRSLIAVINTIYDFKKDFNENLEVLGILKALVKSNTKLHTEVISQTNAFAAKNNIKIFDTIIPNTVQFANAVYYHGKPATLLKDKREYGKAELFFELWNEIEKQIGKEV